MKQIVAILMLVILLSALSFGATAATPEEISKSYFDMLRKNQWEEMAGLYDPAAIKDFRKTLSFIMEMPEGETSQFFTVFSGPGATRKSVKTMSDADFLSHFLGRAMEQAAKLGQFDFKKVEVLGSVPEGDSLRHVVTRTHIGFDETEVEGMEVISFRKTKDGWKMLMQGRMKGMAKQLKRAMVSRQQNSGSR